MACLNAKSIPFWLAEGALLGLIRDGALIPWDEDIDFGLWDSEVTETMILDAFDTEHFHIDSLWRRGIPAMHIYSRSSEFTRHFEITFYTKQHDRAVHQTYFIGASNIRIKIIAFILECVQGKDFFYVHPEKPWLFQVGRRTAYGILSGLFFTFLPERTRQHFQAFLEQYMEFLYRVLLVYDFPARFFEELQMGEFFGVEVKFPKDVEGYLEAAYGKDWRTPKQWDNWWDGATVIGKSK